MRKFHRCFIGLALLFCFACSRRDINYIARVKLQTLGEKEIYDSKKVADVLFDAEELNIDSLRTKSRLLFLQGIDYAKNKKKPAKAIDFFRKSILIMPEAKAYYELGNALMEMRSDVDVKEALQAYEVASELHFSPASLVYYKMASAASNGAQPDYQRAGYFIRTAFENGFSDTAKLKSDPLLMTFATSEDYQTVLRTLSAQDLKDEPNSLFNLFKNAFPVIAKPFEITPEKVNMSDYKKSIGYEFVQFVPEMESSNFGRNTSNDFIFIARLNETPFYTAVLYSSVSYFGDELQPVYTKLVTYSPKGEIIAAKVFAGQFSAERIKAGRFDNNKITVKDYKRIWEQPIDKVAYEKNSVKNYELQAIATFRIDDSGKILEESVPDNFKDSIILVKR